jgi:hypothetical protein
MKRSIVLVGTFWLLAAVAGCSSDPRAGFLDLEISTINKATDQLRSVKVDVDKAVDKATKENKPVTAADLEPAVKAADKLRDIGKELQMLKEKTDALKDSTTKEEREELVKRYQDKLQKALVKLDEAQTAMDQAVKKADEKGPREVVDILKKTLRQAEGEFQTIAKQ